LKKGQPPNKMEALGKQEAAMRSVTIAAKEDIFRKIAKIHGCEERLGMKSIKLEPSIDVASTVGRWGTCQEIVSSRRPRTHAIGVAKKDTSQRNVLLRFDLQTRSMTRFEV